MSPVEPPHVPVMPSPRFFLAVALGAAAFFAFWSWLVLKGEEIPAFDLRCARHWRHWSEAHGRWGFMVFLTDLGGVAAMTLLAVMGAIWQTGLKQRHLAIAWLGIVIGGALINQGFKVAFDRSRPPESLRDLAVLERNNSYPSGHSMGSTVGYGLLAYGLILPLRLRSRRIFTLAVIACIVVAIGFSRMYLRAHWFSDVIGGWAIGIAWLFFCLGWLERQRRHAPNKTY